MAYLISLMFAIIVYEHARKSPGAPHSGLAHPGPLATFEHFQLGSNFAL